MSSGRINLAFLCSLLVAAVLGSLAYVRPGQSTPSRPERAVGGFAAAPSGLVGSGGIGSVVCQVSVDLAAAAEVASFVIELDYREAAASSGRRRRRVTAECGSATLGPEVDLGAARTGTTLTVAGSLVRPGWVAAGELFSCRFAFEDPAWLPIASDFRVSAADTRVVSDGGATELTVAVGEVACHTLGATTTLPPEDGLIVPRTTSTTSTSTLAAPSTTSSTSTTLFAPTTTLPPPPTCGDPTGGGPSAGDALFVLGVVVRTQTCADCVCDVDGSGAVTATDALILLRLSTGQAIELVCPACEF